MKYRAFSIPGSIFLVCALVLLIIVSISLPFFSAMDVARTHFGTGIRSNNEDDAISQLRFGIWSVCFYRASDGDRFCSPRHHGYAVGIRSPTSSDIATVGSSWTRGLAIHPVAAAITFFALLSSFSTHVTITLVASLLSFLAAFLTLIAFACDIALFAFAKHTFGDLDGVNADTDTGPAFWLTFVSFFLLCFAGCTVCFGRRRARMDNASSSYPMTTSSKPFWKRFRRIY
ncbi:hypothetical protein ACEPAI_2266 [Sanghuangporus weigelae]